MVIGIDASRANRKDKTGVEWYAWHVIQELKKTSFKTKTGETIQFVLYTDIPLIGALGELPPNWSVKVLHWPFRYLWTQVRLSWEMFRHPPDVLWIPSHVIPLIHPKKTVVTLHDIAALREPASFSRFRRWYTLWSARFARKHAWRIIMPSEFAKREVEMYTLRGTDITVIPHGYDMRYGEPSLQSSVDAVLSKYNVTQPFFLSVGRLEEKKNTAQIVRAFTMLRDRISAKLVLVGNSGYGFDRIKEAIVESPWKQDIHLLGWLPPEDIIVLMHAAQAFVYPSRAEGFGIPILEAMAAGTPVITSDRGGSFDEVAGDAALFVNPHDADDIGEAMEQMLTNESLRHTLSVKGLERVKQFSWQRSAEETFSTFL